MSWTTSTPEVSRFAVEEPRQKTRTTKKKSPIPSVEDLTVFFRIQFLTVREPVFEYEAYFSEPRSVGRLADEQRKIQAEFGQNLEDLDLPPDND